MPVKVQAITQDGSEVERLRQVERERLRALVEKDLDVARELHADDFELITPGGLAYSKGAYLGEIASGEINYRAWEPEEIVVRHFGQTAIIRYRARIEITLAGRELAPVRTWHTDSYELRDGRWQVVWSQATTIASTKPESFTAR